MSPLVSIIIPTYNRAASLHRPIASVLAQSLEDWECIVIDDGSTDDTADIVASFASEDPRFRYVFQANAGVASARNHGVRVARGSWIQFVDSDDELHPDKLQFQLGFVNSTPARDPLILHSDFRVVWETDQGHPVRELVNRFEPMSNAALLRRIVGWVSEPNVPLHCCNVLLSRTTFDGHRFDERFAGFEDHVFFVELLCAGTVFVHTPIIGFTYRRHQSNLTRDSKLMEAAYLQYLELLLREHPETLDHCMRIGTLFRKAIREQDERGFARLLAIVRSSRVPVYMRGDRFNLRMAALLKLLYWLGGLRKLAARRRRRG